MLGGILLLCDLISSCRWPFNYIEGETESERLKNLLMVALHSSGLQGRVVCSREGGKLNLID